ncbi:MAG: hypothetical protein JWQ90_3113 [Hydrocarboniphaga sp.]|uniref:hypothetical protein n=1 Tax=Hydrocarboniphaga sp. TaxID=2033016 RepID=UPI00262BBD7B|nr:hypothetical protein [Hydrocarboniphaga sp.]MDB5970663.1 hypothetical protein [Hydrocarboniphaga sp.]
MRSLMTGLGRLRAAMARHSVGDSGPRMRCLAMALVLLALPSLGTAADFVYRPVGLKVYQADDVIRARVPGGPSQLGAYVHGISHTLRDVLTQGAAGPGFGAAVLVVVMPGQQSRKWILTPAQLPSDLMDRIQQAVDKLAAPLVQNGPVAFAVQFEAWGGGPLPSATAPELPTPVAWLRALGAQARYPMQDADLAKVWGQ